MARNPDFSLKKLGEATALGLVDVGLEKVDDAMGLSFPVDALTIGRTLLFFGGLAANALTDKAAPYTEALYIAEEPLFIRSLCKGVGLVADYQGVPTREAIELRLRSAGQSITPPSRRAAVQFR